MKEQQEKITQEKAALQDFTMSMISAPGKVTGSGEHTKGVMMPTFMKARTQINKELRHLAWACREARF